MNTSHKYACKSLQALTAVYFTMLAISISQAAEPSQVTTETKPVTIKSLDQEKVEFKSNIELWESRFKSRLQVLEKLQGLDLKKVHHQKIAVDHLRAILADFDEEAAAILQVYANLGPDLKMYREALLKGPPMFEQIAANLERQASEKTSTMLKENYLDFSNQARRVAAMYTDKAKGLDSLEADLGRKIEFVKESRTFVRDVDGFLAAIPAEGGIETEKLIARVNQYIEGFEQAIKAMKNVTQKITEPEPTRVPVPKTAPTTSQAKPESEHVTELRRRLALHNQK